jgi:hypothetical protein
MGSELRCEAGQVVVLDHGHRSLIYLCRRRFVVVVFLLGLVQVIRS